jgi:Asp-tRNA(Asn)/Glu-tRNA(Gln) amidotransferase A subunit family amidase
VPAGEVDGLPVGLQLVAASGSEHLLFRAAGAVETATAGHARRTDPDPSPAH